MFLIESTPDQEFRIIGFGYDKVEFAAVLSEGNDGFLSIGVPAEDPLCGYP